MERSGKAAGINKMANILGICPDTSSRYFQMFADTFLIHPVSIKGKTNERILNPKKIYGGFRYPHLFHRFQGQGCFIRELYLLAY